MSEDIKEVIVALDKNLKNLETAEEINMTDVKTLLTELFGVIKDLFERFEYVFVKTEKIKEIEEATKKGEVYEEKVDNEDIKRLYS